MLTLVTYTLLMKYRCSDRIVYLFVCLMCMRACFYCTSNMFLYKCTFNAGYLIVCLQFRVSVFYSYRILLFSCELSIPLCARFPFSIHILLQQIYRFTFFYIYQAYQHKPRLQTIFTLKDPPFQYGINSMKSASTLYIYEVYVNFAHLIVRFPRRIRFVVAHLFCPIPSIVGRSVVRLKTTHRCEANLESSSGFSSFWHAVSKFIMSSILVNRARA